MLHQILWDKGIKQREFAEMTGLTEVYISKLINKKTSYIEFDKMEKICKTLEITPSDLIKFVDDE
jgi:DNA-binding Xre family transcriptional regulator